MTGSGRFDKLDMDSSLPVSRLVDCILLVDMDPCATVDVSLIALTQLHCGNKEHVVTDFCTMIAQQAAQQASICLNTLSTGGMKLGDSIRIYTALSRLQKMQRFGSGHRGLYQLL